MDVYYNNQKVIIITISPHHTVGQVKLILHNWLAPQGVTNYNIRLFFSNTEELAPVVFTTNTYDNINFHAQKDILTGGRVFITTIIQPVPTQLPPIVPTQTPQMAPTHRPIPTLPIPRDPDDESTVHTVPEELADIIEPNHRENTFALDDEEISTRLTDWVIREGIDVEKGDTIQLSWRDYRNDGTYFVDVTDTGNIEVIDMADEPDEYGTVPPHFRFPEFPLRYFEDVIAHNSYLWIDRSFNDQIRTNVQFGIPPINFDVVPTTNILYSWFDYQGERYWVLSDTDECDNMDRAREMFLAQGPYNYRIAYEDYVVNEEDEENVIYRQIC